MTDKVQASALAIFEAAIEAADEAYTKAYEAETFGGYEAVRAALALAVAYDAANDILQSSAFHPRSNPHE